MSDEARTFWRGFKAVMPLWIGSAPFAVAFAVAALQQGWHALDIQLMSLTVYSAPAQLGAVQSVTAAQPMIAALVTAIAVNLHQALYGLSLNQRMQLTRSQRAISAYLLTDTAYGLCMAVGKQANFAFLLGAEISLYVVWNVATAVGLVVGQTIRLSAWVQVEFVSPLMFIALLVTTIKARAEVMVAVVAVSLTLMCLASGVSSLTVLVASVTAAMIGAGLTKPLVEQAA